MRFDSFEIENFRGIERAVVDLRPSGAGVFTLIGLNESGKTTILEAISKFKIGVDHTSSLYQSKLIEEDPTSFIPKHQKSNFSSSTRITATVSFEPLEKDIVLRAAEKASESRIRTESISDQFKIVRGFSFSDSDFSERINHWELSPSGREKGGRIDKEFSDQSGPWKALVAAIRSRLPEILYFPTFLFDQPERIVLNPQGKEDKVDRLYREIIESVANSLERPLNIKAHIVDRALATDSPADKIMGIFSIAPNKQQQINAVLDDLSAHLTETVFNSWSKIFRGSFSGREIRLRLGVDQHPDGAPRVYLQFALKDGIQQYDISERSLGFRWFFSFLLFTLYRVSGANTHPTLFLLDEPASNLHSGAQMQLIESFRRIAKGSNQLIYSTHSHYMINPEWLDQAFIVSNTAIDYDDVTESASSKRRHTDIHIDKYRDFVGKNPDKLTYFQPVLDKLEVLPSRLDAVRPAILVEGKGDYLILEYGRSVLLESPAEYAIVPTRGAEGFGELVGLLLGWGGPFSLCFDSDRAGRKAREEFVTEWGLPRDRCMTLEDIDPALSNHRIEHLLTDEDLQLISNHFSIADRPSKSQIQLFFSEHLARRAKAPLSNTFVDRVRRMDSLFSTSLLVGARRV